MRREGESGEGADLRLRDLALAFPCRALECQLSSNLLMAGINCRGWLAAPRRRRQRLNPQRLASLLCGIFASLWPFSVTFFVSERRARLNFFFFFGFKLFEAFPAPRSPPRTREKAGCGQPMLTPAPAQAGCAFPLQQ